MFNVHVVLMACFVLVLLFFKPARNQGFRPRYFLFAVISGPVLLIIIFFAAQLSPILLKRYVLFTILGFILLFAYTFSLLRINFTIKLAGFAVLSFFSFRSMTFPRASSEEYDKAAWFFKRVHAPNVFITNDLPDLLSYYYDHSCFNLRPYPVKFACLRERGIYTPFNQTWPNDEDLSKYRVVYYTHTFAGYYDAQHQVESALGARFKFIGRWDHYRGLHILVYYNPNYKPA